VTQAHFNRQGWQGLPVRGKQVLHVGCGPRGPHRLHPVFAAGGDWEEIRLDLDPAVQPDIVCSTVDMRGHVPSASVDAVWSSHNMEHLHDHEVPRALAEFHRVLRPDGFFLMRCPDLQSVMEAFLENGLESVAYTSPAGPITPLDMIYGHRPSIAAGNAFMAHKTGFTDMRLARMLLEAGFAGVNTKRAHGFDLWAVAFCAGTDMDACLAALAQNGINFTR
jgi:predicted SAM-dependent methyltransferase